MIDFLISVFIWVAVCTVVIYEITAHIKRKSTERAYSREIDTQTQHEIASFEKQRKRIEQTGSTILRSREIQSGEPYALFLRPFTFDSRWNKMCSIPIENRSLSWFLMNHEHKTPLFYNLASSRIWQFDVPDDIRLAVSALHYLDREILMRIDHILAFALAGELPLIGLGEGETQSRYLGATFMMSDHSDWQEQILSLMVSAKVIFFIPWITDGTKWELDRILSNDKLLDKAVFFLLSPNELCANYKMMQEEEITQLNDICSEIESLLLARNVRLQVSNPRFRENLSKYHTGCYRLNRGDDFFELEELFPLIRYGHLFDEIKVLSSGIRGSQRETQESGGNPGTPYGGQRYQVPLTSGAKVPGTINGGKGTGKGTRYH